MNRNLVDDEVLLQKKKKRYNKIESLVKNKLLDMVLSKKWLLKDAAKELKMNYSTAKTIMRKNREIQKKAVLQSQSKEESENHKISHNLNEQLSAFIDGKQVFSGTEIKTFPQGINYRSKYEQMCKEGFLNQTQLAEISKIMESSIEAIKTNQQLIILITLLMASNAKYFQSHELLKLVSILNISIVS